MKLKLVGDGTGVARYCPTFSNAFSKFKGKMGKEPMEADVAALMERLENGEPKQRCAAVKELKKAAKAGADISAAVPVLVKFAGETVGWLISAVEKEEEIRAAKHATPENDNVKQINQLEDSFGSIIKVGLRNFRKMFAVPNARKCIVLVVCGASREGFARELPALVSMLESADAGIREESARTLALGAVNGIPMRSCAVALGKHAVEDAKLTGYCLTALKVAAKNGEDVDAAVPFVAKMLLKKERDEVKQAAEILEALLERGDSKTSECVASGLMEFVASPGFVRAAEGNTKQYELAAVLINYLLKNSWKNRGGSDE